jgi:hypothetical protein
LRGVREVGGLHGNEATVRRLGGTRGRWWQRRELQALVGECRESGWRSAVAGLSRAEVVWQFSKRWAQKRDKWRRPGRAHRVPVSRRGRESRQQAGSDWSRGAQGKGMGLSICGSGRVNGSGQAH